MQTSPPHDRVCIGGPLDGQRIVVDCPDGFLAADRQAGLAWRYKPAAGDIWLLDCSHDNSLIYPQGPATGERRLDWARLPLEADPMPVVAVGDNDEAYAGDPVDDGWETP